MKVAILASENSNSAGVWRAAAAIVALGLSAGPVVAQTAEQTGRNEATAKAPATQEELAVSTITTATS